MTEKLTIDIWSDVMCPWCVIGYHQLMKGLDLVRGEIEAEIRWRPFELNPDMPPEGEEQGAHIARKYGRSPDQVAAGREQMHRIAERAGYSFAWAGDGDPPPAMMRNTFLAHKLLGWALEQAGPAAQTRLKLALFDAHFQRRRDIGDPAVLLDIAQEQGFDRAAAQAALGDERLGQKVRGEQAQAWDRNITGVPAMLIEGKYLVPGAQEPEVYADALRRVVARERAAAPTA
jgi:predicted DsbA family dithiol-disulfide isomerase